MQQAPLAYSVEETLATLGIGRDKLYKIIKAKQLPARKLGRRTLILLAISTLLSSRCRNLAPINLGFDSGPPAKKKPAASPNSCRPDSEILQ